MFAPEASSFIQSGVCFVLNKDVYKGVKQFAEACRTTADLNVQQIFSSFDYFHTLDVVAYLI